MSETAVVIQMSPTALAGSDLEASGLIRATNQGFNTPEFALAWIEANFGSNSAHTFHVISAGGPWRSWERFLPMKLRNELQSVLDSIRGLSPDELPELLGELEVIRVTAMQRLSAPRFVPQHEELLDVNMAAKRLGMAPSWLYDNHYRLPFTRRNGRRLLFSSLGIDKYIRKN